MAKRRAPPSTSDQEATKAVVTTDQGIESPLTPNAKQVNSKASLHSGMNAAAVVMAYAAPFGEVDMETIVVTLNDSVRAVQAGDMKQPEAMLIAQATALQSIFMNLSRRALRQEYQSHLESFLRMALKAQNQCRMTLETLATLKNPQVIFARQANINNGGQQQVNNGSASRPPAEAAHQPRAQEVTPRQNKLLEESHGQWLDTGTQGQAGRADQAMGAMEEVHRTPHEQGQGGDGPERLQRRHLA